MATTPNWYQRFRHGRLDHLFWRLSPVFWALAAIWRRLLVRTTFVAITGSVGKTTAKELTAAALARRGRVSATRGSGNSRLLLALTVLRVRPWHRFAVVEAATGTPGQMAAAARLLRPDVAVILSVARTHTTAFASLDDTAAEKAALLGGLRPGGVAVLNADDPRVAAMRPPASSRTLSFGTAPGCDARVRSTASEWPSRLVVELEVGGSRVRCGTRLVGAHWWPTVAAAMAVATTCGVAPEQAAAAIAEVGPTVGRLSPVRAPSGAVILRDDFNGSVDTLLASLEVLRAARGVRRCLVLSDFSDVDESFRGRFRMLPALLDGAVDTVLLTGEHAAYGRRRLLEAGFDSASVEAVERLEDTAAALRERFGPGDLVLLRGRSTDHLARLAVAQFGGISCWRSRCTILTLCDECRWIGADASALRAASLDADQSGPQSGSSGPRRKA